MNSAVKDPFVSAAVQLCNFGARPLSAIFDALEIVVIGRGGRLRCAAVAAGAIWSGSFDERVALFDAGVARMRAVSQCQVTWVPSWGGSSPSNKRLERAVVAQGGRRLTRLENEHTRERLMRAHAAAQAHR